MVGVIPLREEYKEQQKETPNKMTDKQSDDDNHADQLNPNNPEYQGD